MNKDFETNKGFGTTNTNKTTNKGFDKNTGKGGFADKTKQDTFGKDKLNQDKTKNTGFGSGGTFGGDKEKNK